MSGWMISLTITLTLGIAAWFCRKSKSDVFRYGVLMAFIVSALVLLNFIPGGNPLLINKENPGHLSGTKKPKRLY